MKGFLGLAVGVTSILLIVSMAGAQTIQYTATMLGRVCDQCNTLAIGVNKHGIVMGNIYNQTPGSWHTFLWSAKTGMTDIGTVPNGADQTIGFAINDQNEITGYLTLVPSGYDVFTYRNGEFRLLGIGGISAGLAINKFGEIAGYFSYDPSDLNKHHGFRYVKGLIEEIVGLYLANGINDYGDVVGFTTGESATRQAAVLFDGETDITTLVGPISSATGINNSRAVIGGDQNGAFVWQNGLITHLGTLGGAVSGPYAINDSGDIVGTSTDALEIAHGFLYRDGHMYKLEDLVVQLPAECHRIWEARAINNRGDIVGTCATPDPVNPGGEAWSEAILLSPLKH